MRKNRFLLFPFIFLFSCKAYVQSTSKKDTLSLLDRNNWTVNDYIKKCPDDYSDTLKSLIKSYVEEWKDIPNPLVAYYKGNDFGDYFHVNFEDKNGVNYDFGQANNNYGKHTLYEPFGQYNDNPKYLNKLFKIHWDWKLSKFLCCDGEYKESEAFIPSIIKLELIKN